MTLFDWLWNGSLIGFGWFLYDITTKFHPTTNSAPMKYIGLVVGMLILLGLLRTAPEIVGVIVVEHIAFVAIWIYTYWYRYYSAKR